MSRLLTFIFIISFLIPSAFAANNTPLCQGDAYAWLQDYPLNKNQGPPSKTPGFQTGNPSSNNSTSTTSHSTATSSSSNATQVEATFENYINILCQGQNDSESPAKCAVALLKAGSPQITTIQQAANLCKGVSSDGEAQERYTCIQNNVQQHYPHYHWPVNPWLDAAYVWPIYPVWIWNYDLIVFSTYDPIIEASSFSSSASFSFSSAGGGSSSAGDGSGSSGGGSGSSGGGSGSSGGGSGSSGGGTDSSSGGTDSSGGGTGSSGGDGTGGDASSGAADFMELDKRMALERSGYNYGSLAGQCVSGAGSIHSNNPFVWSALAAAGAAQLLLGGGN